MSEKPILSIVTPTLGNFSEYWLEQLLRIKGAVQFVLVYPPGATIKFIDDSRVKSLTSPSKGEVMQRFTGLINASGEYVLALDDDDFLHPDVLELTTQYFEKFPQSWVLRLKIENIDSLNEERFKQQWEDIPDVDRLEICQKTAENPFPFQQGNYTGLLEVPIAPLDKKFDLRHAVWPWTPRKDMHGIHFENFNNRIWRNELVQQSLPDLSQVMKVMGALTWVPSWSLDRALGLFVQAKFFNKDAIIGHWLPKPEQVRYSYRDPSLKEPRSILAADALLVKRFPQYGYFWNLFFNQLYDIPKMLAKSVKRKLNK